MNLTVLDKLLWLGGFLANVLLLGVLLFRRRYQRFPIVTAFIGYSIASDPATLLAYHALSATGYFRTFLVDSFAQNLFQLGMLYEVAAVLLRPVKRELPKGSFQIFISLLFLGAIGTFLLSAHSGPEQLHYLGDWFIRISFVSAILRLVIFSAIIMFSQLFDIGWKHHVLQLASGFAFYAGVTLLIELLHRYLGLNEFHVLEQARIAAWIATLGYWSYSLAQKEAPRKEFDPQMAKILVSISQSARRDKTALINMDRK